jgi:hypothetical protein
MYKHLQPGKWVQMLSNRIKSCKKTFRKLAFTFNLCFVFNNQNKQVG